MWTIFTVLATLVFVFLFVVGLISVIRDLLQRPLYLSAILDDFEEDMHPSDAASAAKTQLDLAEIEKIGPLPQSKQLSEASPRLG
jgi:hypothetical protein